MTKGTIGIVVECAKCGGSVLEVPDNPAHDTLIPCGQCGNFIGPYGAIEAALQGQAHTGLHGGFTKMAFKPI